ncbi:hypothetical protein R69927_06451 [Paraburkholderia domus]|jgi:hypothetical protein|uniref:Uncharacterized protein n=1 Tax=Paraburkholderia domus TaxID=2793075 RepID=A0A9N8N9Q2_9BURK|nr:hypothetical protein [Paraburkholderia domus]MBK5053845.1 hypothetical protein [Burkholderia sp. R-70006]MBK5065504.1 hypothetical protein [Burkholderia sp. R-70199]MBK5090530.1 hypothetical protein [Burkholderia sp. R-69927]MBK5120082.1 hypothetical protein [Burkholderia sp. R-69980]MBK5169896.1 hypothetical protein [Burkholderia sp. R-70211]MBK5184830.1 hypothetical protein [Burkholderia sp. R-69749]MCI0151008.1 hypothetical protein [Paraburkholderia sediminicola]
MVERRFSRDAGSLAHRAYTLQPARPLALRVTMWVLVCALGAAAGGAAVVAWQAQRAGTPVDQCSAAPVDEGSEQAELSRTRLALAQEAAARAAVQKTADGAAAEVARLNAELQFLRGQSKTKPPAPRS